LSKQNSKYFESMKRAIDYAINEKFGNVKIKIGLLARVIYVSLNVIQNSFL
jgi:hypothetical protein